MFRRSTCKLTLSVLCLMCFRSAPVEAAVIVGYDFSSILAGQTPVTWAATSTASQITGIAFSRGPGLVANSAPSAFNTRDWDEGPGSDADDYLSFGFTVQTGYNVTLSSLQIGTRASGTGPDQLGLFSSLDGFATEFTTNVTRIYQTNGTDVMSAVSLTSPLFTNLTGTVEFRLRQIGNGSAQNPLVAPSSVGTLRVINNTTAGQVALNGIVATAVPEPGATTMTVAALLAGFIVRRKRLTPDVCRPY